MAGGEAHIIINGTELTFAQSMTMRVAIAHFLTDLAVEGLGDDEHGITMTALYRESGGQVQRLMMKGKV